ncbi:hypothetical protein PSH79_08820 [Pseudomonas sp. FP2196]|uniref:hypothetical protein n=1 Tax=Pseudomonas sp. FP2196 TaxID=2954086 RepID=UPI002736FAF7|nr:hypothetical protein [Pseudomonas sp. FP2196]WLH37390.1 hypothetical protein PSH79_08820 [Pseudomonas sp. FP2196]
MSAVVLPVGANPQFGQCSLEVFVGEGRLLNELNVLGRREHVGRFGAFAAALQGALLRLQFGLLAQLLSMTWYPLRVLVRTSIG